MTTACSRDPIILCIDVTEDWFTNLPESVSADRTRDYRYYRDMFGSSGCLLTTRDRVMPPERFEQITREFRFIGLIEFGCGKSFADLQARHVDDYLRLERLSVHPQSTIGPVTLIESETHVSYVLPPSATPEEAYLKYKRECFRYAVKEREAQIASLLDHIERASLREFIEAICGYPIDRRVAIITFPDKVWGIHPHFEWGADVVIFERSGWNDNAQIATAFLRGGAREYGRQWAFDMSPWSGSHIYGRGPTTYDERGVHVAGFSASMHWFSWVHPLMAGSSIIRQQACENTFFILKQPTYFGTSNCDTANRTGMPYPDAFRLKDPAESGALLSPVGVYAQKLHQLISNPNFERGKPVVPLALMVPLRHGWDVSMFTKEQGVWAGSVPIERGDLMLYALFDFLLPGYRKAGRMMDPAFNDRVPFSSEYEMMRMMYDGLDVRPFEEGMFVPTPFGDSFDVVTDHVDDVLLSQYPLLILAGRLCLNPDLLPRLKRYVEQGGTLIVHGKGVGLTGPDIPEDYRRAVEQFLGLRIVSDYSPGFSPTRLVGTDESFGEGKYEYVLAEPTTARPLAVNQEAQPHPIVTLNALGKGRVIFSAPHHHMTLTGRRLLNGVQAVLAGLIKPLIPIAVKGDPIQFQVNVNSRGYVVALYNWNAAVWQGALQCPGMREVKAVAEIMSSSHIPVRRSGKVAEFTATVNPYDVSLYQIDCPH